jgi:hypothetical protein
VGPEASSPVTSNLVHRRPHRFAADTFCHAARSSMTRRGAIGTVPCLSPKGTTNVRSRARSPLCSILFVGLTGVLALACNKDEKKPDDAKATTSTAATATATAKATTTAPATVTCKALVDHIVAVQEAEKKEGLITRANAEKMTGRCEKANNIKDTPDVVKCVMAAEKVAALGACKDLGKLLGPW